VRERETERERERDRERHTQCQRERESERERARERERESMQTNVAQVSDAINKLARSLHHTAACSHTLQHNTQYQQLIYLLQYTAIHSNTPQHAVTHSNTTHNSGASIQRDTRTGTLAATHCDTLRYTAARRNTLPRSATQDTVPAIRV